MFVLANVIFFQKQAPSRTVFIKLLQHSQYLEGMYYTTKKFASTKIFLNTIQNIPPMNPCPLQKFSRYRRRLFQRWKLDCSCWICNVCGQRIKQSEQNWRTKGNRYLKLNPHWIEVYQWHRHVVAATRTKKKLSLQSSVNMHKNQRRLHSKTPIFCILQKIMIRKCREGNTNPQFVCRKVIRDSG